MNCLLSSANLPTVADIILCFLTVFWHIPMALWIYFDLHHCYALVSTGKTRTPLSQGHKGLAPYARWWPTRGACLPTQMLTGATIMMIGVWSEHILSRLVVERLVGSPRNTCVWHSHPQKWSMLLFAKLWRSLFGWLNSQDSRCFDPQHDDGQCWQSGRNGTCEESHFS